MSENQAKTKEINLIELAKVLWDFRRTIIKVTLSFTLIGLLVAILSPKEYTTSVTIVPQSSNQQSSMGNLGGLAAMAGINLNTPAQAEISPSAYPQIISSVPFQLELMNTYLTFDKIDHPITLYEYYSEHVKPGFIYKYTLGLPKLISGAFKKNQSPTEEKSPDGIIKVTEEQKYVRNILRKKISIERNQKEDYIKLSCRMPEALPSAQLAQQMQELLQQKITEYKVQKATANLEFIQQRYDELQQQYNNAQDVLAKFSDRNKNVTSATAQIELERLTNDYNLAFSIYSEMAKQLEQAKIQVKEDTPVFVVIEPASVPLEKSKPKRLMIIIISLLAGGIVGIGIAILKNKANILIIHKEENKQL